jgi:23S rRNA (uracil1939-C5)-methyltransferase
MEYKKNDIVTVSIEDIGNDGEGIGKTEGYTLFVKDAVLGDTVEARITKCKKNYGYARVEKVITPSPFRVEPKCTLHRRCGGCQIQAMDYAKQLSFKQNKVRNHLVRIGGFDEKLVDTVMEPIVGMDRPWHYRNKAQFPVGYDKEGNLVTGFYAGRTHDIIANTDCALGVEENKAILETVLEYMRENQVTAYREAEGKGLVRHILIRTGFHSGQIMVCLVINGKKLPREDKLVEKLLGIAFPEEDGREKQIASISVSVNTENTNVIMGKEIRVLWGKERIQDQLGEIQFSISPLSFYQVNPLQTEKLYGLAVEYAGLTGKETVWDLYCGIGTISLFMAQKAKQVYGVEIIPQAIEDARENARCNGITNAEFYVGKAEEVLPEFYEKASVKQDFSDTDKLHPDVIVVDPPRKGCDERCLETLLAMHPERIVYVSCDSATLARDLKILCEGGYELKKVRPVDQFGQTVHVETVVLLSKGAKGPVDLCSARTEVERRMVDSRKVKVDFSLEDMDLSEFKGKATYEQIKAYVLEQTGLKVSSLYIAQIKKKCGLDVGENFNLAKSENARQPKCTPEKEDAIMQAFRHFGII